MSNIYQDYPKIKGWSKFFHYNDSMAKQYGDIFNGLDLKCKKVLEVGYGSGALLKWLSSAGAEVYGVEIQSELVNAARENGIKAYEDLSRLKDEKFDMILAFDVLEHLKKDEIQVLLHELTGILSENGMFIFRFPNCQSPAGLLTQNADHTHVTQLSVPIVDFYLKNNKVDIYRITEGKSESYFLRNKISNYLIDQYRKFIRFQLGIALGSTSIPLYSDIIIYAKKNSQK